MPFDLHPPAFYGIQALWYAIVGATPAAGMLLIGLIAAVTALVLFLRLRDLYGTWTACLSLAVYFSLPVVRFGSSTLMPDMGGPVRDARSLRLL